MTPDPPAQSRHRSAVFLPIVPAIQAVPALCPVAETGSSKLRTQASTRLVLIYLLALMSSQVSANDLHYLQRVTLAASATIRLTRDARSKATWMAPNPPTQSRHRSAVINNTVPAVQVVPALCSVPETEPSTLGTLASTCTFLMTLLALMYSRISVHAMQQQQQRFATLMLNMLTRDARLIALWMTPDPPTQSCHRSAAINNTVPAIQVVPALCSAPETESSRICSLASIHVQLILMLALMCLPVSVNNSP